jgi:hypothetical protein
MRCYTRFFATLPDPGTPQHWHWRLESLVTGTRVVGGEAIAFIWGGSPPIEPLWYLLCRLFVHARHVQVDVLVVADDHVTAFYPRRIT